MDSQELCEMEAEFALQPWGDREEDHRTALIASTIARCNGNEVTAEDFMPQRGPSETPDERMLRECRERMQKNGR